MPGKWHDADHSGVFLFGDSLETIQRVGYLCFPSFPSTNGEREGYAPKGEKQERENRINDINIYYIRSSQDFICCVSGGEPQNL